MSLIQIQNTLDGIITKGKELAEQLGAKFYKAIVFPDGSAVAVLKKEGKRFEHPLEGSFDTVVAFIQIRAVTQFSQTWWVNIPARRDPSFGNENRLLRFFPKTQPQSLHECSMMAAE